MNKNLEAFHYAVSPSLTLFTLSWAQLFSASSIFRTQTLFFP